MTTIALDDTASSARRVAPHRILSVLRLYYVSPTSTVVVPLLIMAFIFLVNYAVWVIIFANVTDPADRADTRAGLEWSGASFYIYVYMMVVAVQSMNLTFPYAQSLSVTRRDFYLGASAAFVSLSVGYGALLTALASIEDATDGWGLGGRMFTSVYFGGGEWYVRFATYTTLLLFFFFVGAAVATVYVRWRPNGILIFFAALTVLIVGAGALITVTSSWPAVGDWFVSNGANGVIAWTLVPTVLSALVGYLVLRKATPRS
ncbi:hypothetical protein HD599_000919 [Conyzicola lurida]|uniref:Uncharacterized protein n=1 Tax=Conyzicola lurida TaxID=1172621 RepID=A0A841ALK6_9MICO|nr:hypothetical protein [Conyzicola lurida]MBB5842596.1 hypothetical protein [Conyzicola lurida]